MLPVVAISAGLRYPVGEPSVKLVVELAWRVVPAVTARSPVRFGAPPLLKAATLWEAFCNVTIPALAIVRFPNPSLPVEATQKCSRVTVVPPV